MKYKDIYTEAPANPDTLSLLLWPASGSATTASTPIRRRAAPKRSPTSRRGTSR